MARELWGCIVGVVKHWAAAFSLLLLVLGILRETGVTWEAIPAWFWWVAAVAAMFITACQIQWRLDRERDKNHASHSKITMNEASRYIASHSRWLKLRPNDDEGSWAIDLRNDLSDALGLGRLVAFGREGPVPQGRFKRPQREIAKEEWTDLEADIFDGLMGAKTENTASRRHSRGEVVFHDVAFSKRQLLELWPRLGPIGRRLYKPLPPTRD